MKKLFIVVALSMLLSGCGTLLPKQVEFFQRKVKSVPELPDSGKEHQRQAAQYVAQKIEETKLAATADKASPDVIGPVLEASAAADALAESLGPPKSAFDTETEAAPLVTSLHKDQAKLNTKIADYSEAVQKDVGKKIEGTGLIRIGYFTYIGIILLVGCLIWGALKIYGTMNPAVGLGVNTVSSVASTVLSKGFSEVVAGGEAFKTYVENSPLTADVKAYVQSLFVQAQTSNQSQDVQKLVNTLTDNPSAVVAPPLSPAPTVAAPAPAPVIPPAK